MDGPFRFILPEEQDGDELNGIRKCPCGPRTDYCNDKKSNIMEGNDLLISEEQELLLKKNL